MTIAVVGATGNTGRAVVKELKALGQNPVCVVRNAEKAREVLGADAKTAVAELTDRAALEKALQGVETCSWSPAIDPQMAEQQNNVLDATLKAGAKYLVRVGGGRAVAVADSESVRRPRSRRDRGAAARQRHQVGDPASRPVHAERDGPGGVDQERQQDGDVVRQGSAGRADRRSRHRRGRRPHPRRSGAACRQGLRIHRQADQLRRIRRGVFAGAGQAGSPTSQSPPSRPNRE